MKKFVSLVLTVLFLLTSIPVFAARERIFMTEIGDLKPHLEKDFEIDSGIGYKRDGKYIPINSSELTTEDISYFADVFSDKNFICVNEELTFSENDFDETGNLFFLGINGIDNYIVAFNENYVYIRMFTSDESLSDVKWYHGLFEYKDKTLYNDIIEYMESITEEKEAAEEENEEESKPALKNQVQISDLKNLYTASFPWKFAEDVEWGVCSYVYEGETEPVLACYLMPYKYVSLICKDVENNHIKFENGGRVLSAYKESIEYDMNFTVTYNFDFEITVNEDMQVETLTLTSTHYQGGTPKTEEIDMSTYTQSGALPKELFSVTEIEEENIEETVVTETEPEETEKEETLVEEEKTEETTEEEKTVTEEEKTEETTEEEKTEKSLEDVTEEKAEETENTTEEQTEKSYADKLNEIGLFKGTENGYELESTFTRAQGAAMLVRLLGKEEEALKITPTGIFSDVPADNWAAPYVEYCYSNDITKGTGEGTYTPNEAVNGVQYITLVLRALGYTDAEPETASDMAKEVNLLSEKESADMTKTTELTREEMVYISYNALSVKMPSGKTLIEKLTEEKAE